jgi:large subunit ribosomal protein L10
MVNDTKQKQVQSLIDAIEQTGNFALVKFEKTLHTTLEALRTDLRETDTKFKVIKNTLFEIALNKLAHKEKKFRELKTQAAALKENSALLLLGKEWNKGLTAFHKFAKKDQTLSFKVGIIDQELYVSNDLIRLAQLPSKEELVAKVIGNMKTPISKFNYALKFNLQKFAYILSEKSKQS